ncbi:MAG: argininosuccinate synthase, partial [Planctomycetes bacterium]|nr:argininosuccinate synthase [Planctomycetota bacterium]
MSVARPAAPAPAAPRPKVVLAFSGGLDTSFCVPWLTERGYEVITVFVDTGGTTPDRVAAIAERARALGAARHHSVSGEAEIFDKFISWLIKGGAFYQDQYPLLCSDRYLIVEKSVEVARREGATIIAHGCTAMGNDQARFDISVRALGDFEILAPIRDYHAEVKTDLRAREIEFLEARGFEVAKAHRTYSINQNVCGVTISGSEIDQLREPAESAFVLTAPLDQTPDAPQYVRVDFERGLPVAVDGRRAHGIELLKGLNETGGRHGIGRYLYTGDCVVGIKGRIAFECPGITALAAAHKALEEAVLSREENQFKAVAAAKWTTLIFSGLYFDPLREDLEAFLESTQRFVSGHVVLKLWKGRCMAVEYASPHLLKDPHAVYAQSASWSPAEGAAFVKLFGMSTTLAGRRS